MHEHRVLDGTGAPTALHLGRDTHRLGEIGQPEREIEERQPVLEKRPAARLGASVPPAVEAFLDLIMAGADASQPTELATSKEPIERLHVTPETMVERRQYFPFRALPR